MSKANKKKQSELILSAAYKCISSKGYANVSMREIANEAGVALSQLHYYFGSKKELFREIIKRMMEKYLIEVKRHLKKGATANEKVSSLIIFFKKLLTQNQQLFYMLCDLTSLALWSDSFRDLISSLFNDLTNMIEDILFSNASLKENLKGYSSEKLSRMILGAMFGVGVQVLLDPSDEEMIDSLNTIQIIFD